MKYLKERTIPYWYLYDTKGSALFDDITNLKEYYPFKKEQELIDIHVKEMITFNDDLVTEGVYLVEFGAGYSEKTEKFILNLLERYEKVIFVPIDVSESACLITKEKYKNLPKLEVRPYVGTYDMFLNDKLYFELRVIYLFLGSSIGNFELGNQLSFLTKVSEIMSFRDILLIGYDTNYKDPGVILKAYNDDSGVTREFILNILTHLNEKYKLNLKREDFEYTPKWNEKLSRVEMSIECVNTCTIKSTDSEVEETIQKGEKIHIEYSHKFNVEMIESSAKKTNLILKNTFFTEDKYHMMGLFLKDVSPIWSRTDYIFKNLIGYDNLNIQPIELRNPLIFYLGHIYAFYDIKVNKLPTDSVYYILFERGRDPFVNNPEICHRTSELPETYPGYEEILKYNEDVKGSITQWIKTKGYTFDLLTSVEHELMHQETMFYLIRKMEVNLISENYDSILTGYTPPEKKQVLIPEKHLQQGTNETFVWDNEMPAHKIKVNEFTVDNLPVTWAEMKLFFEENLDLIQQGKVLNLNENFEIRISESKWISFEEGKYFPAWVNLEIANLYLKWKNSQGIKCRLMTEDEFDSLATGCNKVYSGNSDFKFLHPVPVGFCKDYSNEGVYELFGNGWELTQTNFRPFEGFTPQDNYSEYSQDFFTDVHFVLKGASPFTSANLLRKSFRNWYQYNYLYHVAKFRLVYSN